MPSIHPVAVIRQLPDQSYACVVRWVLGDADELPASSDVFDVTLSLYNQDGTSAGAVGTYQAKPLLYAMLDTPRQSSAAPAPAGQTLTWEVSTQPTCPVNPADGANGDLSGYPFGVCHLLEETHPSRVEWRVAKIMYQAMQQRSSSFELSTLSNEKLFAQSALIFARALLNSGIRPSELGVTLSSVRSSVRQFATQNTAGKSTVTLPALLDGPGKTVAAKMLHVSLVAHTLADTNVVAQLDSVVTGAAQTRQHLRLRALHGGHLVDYWADPQNGGGGIQEQDRGRTYPAAELLGLGITIPIPQAALEEWLVRRLRVVVSVNRSGPPFVAAKMVAFNSEAPGNTRLAPTNLTEGVAPPIDYPAIKRALLLGSSHPPAKPEGALVNYEVYQSNSAQTAPGKSSNGPMLGYATGDGRVEIHIQEPAVPESERSVAAFNVYAMWESPATQPFFQDGGPSPTLNVLRPWLVSRRYSFEHDLKEAFPNMAGNVHPKLRDLLENPPWQPVLLQPDRIADLSEGGNETLPNLTPARTAVFSWDLRAAMHLSSHLPSGLFKGWDLASPVNAGWTPDRKRDDSAADGQPQAYRIWVTSIDAFEQESEPVAVTTHDPDAGELIPTYRYYPRRRVSLLNSPAQDNSVFGIRYDAGLKSLTVSFETPYDNQIAGFQGAAGAPRLDPQWIRAFSVIWRRRLALPVESSSTMRFAALFSVPEIPQWQDCDRKMRSEGWERFKKLEAVEPMAGHTWQVSTGELPEAVEGWEYTAGVGFLVSAAGERFWMPNIFLKADTGRRVLFSSAKPRAKATAVVANGEVQSISVNEGGGRYDKAPPVFFRGGNGIGARAEAEIRAGAVTAIRVIVPGSGYSVAPEVVIAEEYITTPGRINEIPRASDVAVTQSVAVPNHNIPHSPDFLPGTRVWTATPVLPPPGVHRDLVLMRLLSQGFTRGGALVAPQPWRDTEVSLTLGQIAMCEAALERTPVLETLSGLDDSVLKISRLVLANDLRTKNGERLRQHATVGFRGLLDLQWSYTPLQANQDDTLAEAVRFRIFHARIPAMPSEARKLSTVRGTGTQIKEGLYRLAIEGTSVDGWSAVCAPTQPVAVCAWAAGQRWIGTLLEASGDAASAQVILTVREEDAIRPMPAKMEMLLFLSQTLAELPVTNYAGTTDYRVLLPIGGGNRETMGWWVSSISAQGRISSRATSPCTLREFRSTIEPSPLESFSATVPTDLTQHLLDPAGDRVWLPTDLVTLTQARFSPRLLLTWQATTRELGVAIQREERQRPSGDISKLSLNAPTPWEAIKQIESTPDEQNLAEEALDAIRSNWLLGQTVESDPAAAPEDHFGPSLGLRGETGARGFTVDGAVRPGVVDYFARNGDTQRMMDANWEFRYRACTVIDLGPTIDARWRYLRSKATGWTSFFLPETPRLVLGLRGDKPPTESRTRPRPCVRFRFFPGVTQLDAQRRAAHPEWFALRPAQKSEGTSRWEYRIIIRRKLAVPVPATGAQPPELWFDIGNPCSLADIVDEVVDFELEREWPGQDLTCDYWIIAQQFMVTENETTRTEKLVRGFDLSTQNHGNLRLKVRIPAPSDGQAEVEVLREVAIA